MGRSPYRRMSEEEHQKLVRLRDEEGLPFYIIAERFGRSTHSISKAYKVYKEKERKCQDKE